MKRYALTLVLCVLSASAAFAQTKSPVEGVWKVAEVVPASSSAAEKPKPITNPQPGSVDLHKGLLQLCSRDRGKPET